MNEAVIVAALRTAVGKAPRGIAHRINGGKGFLRMVFYSRQLVHPKAFNSSAGRQSNFEVQ